MTKLLRSLSLEESIWNQVDELRGDIPRSRFIARILADSLELSQTKSNTDNHKAITQ